jgi:hypothetical protein
MIKNLHQRILGQMKIMILRKKRRNLIRNLWSKLDSSKSNIIRKT